MFFLFLLALKGNSADWTVLAQRAKCEEKNLHCLTTAVIKKKKRAQINKQINKSHHGFTKVPLTCWAGCCRLLSGPGAPQSPAVAWSCAAAAPPCQLWSAPPPAPGRSAPPSAPRAAARRPSADRPAYEPAGRTRGKINIQEKWILLKTARISDWTSKQRWTFPWLDLI